jgi:hypothetical protein
MRGINHVAVVVAVVLHQVVGFLWYAVAFAKQGLAGWKPEGVNEAAPSLIVLDVLGWLLAAYVVAWLVRETRRHSAAGGALLGALLWLGVAAPTLVPHYAFGGVPAAIIMVDAANALVGYVLTGAVIGGWPTKRQAA